MDKDGYLKYKTVDSKMSDDFKKYFEELKKEAETFYQNDEPSTYEDGVEINERRLPIRKSFIKKYPGFSAQMFSIQAKVEELKLLVYKELDKLNISESALAERSHLNKQTLNKILNRQCFPNRKTLLALCVGLHYTPEEASILLKTMGYTFNHSDISDLIVYTALEKKEYDIDKINTYIYEAGYYSFIGSIALDDKYQDDDDISFLPDDEFINIVDYIERTNCKTYEELVRYTGLREGQVINFLEQMTIRKRMMNHGYSSAIVQIVLRLKSFKVDPDIIIKACEISKEQYDEIVEMYETKYGV